MRKNLQIYQSVAGIISSFSDLQIKQAKSNNHKED